MFVYIIELFIIRNLRYINTSGHQQQERVLYYFKGGWRKTTRATDFFFAFFFVVLVTVVSAYSGHQRFSLPAGQYSGLLVYCGKRRFGPGNASGVQRRSTGLVFFFVVVDPLLNNMKKILILYILILIILKFI